MADLNFGFVRSSPDYIEYQFVTPGKKTKIVVSEKRYGGIVPTWYVGVERFVETAIGTEWKHEKGTAQSFGPNGDLAFLRAKKMWEDEAAVEKRDLLNLAHTHENPGK